MNAESPARIYQVTIQGRTLESRNLKQLLARAVSEKRDVDRRYRVLMSSRPPAGRLSRQSETCCG